MTDLDQVIFNFKNKDEKAFQELYITYNKSIYGIIFKIVKNRAIAEELMHDTFLKAWQNADSYSAKKGRFFTWLLNIARNTAIDKIRTKSYKQTTTNLDSDYFSNSISSYENLDAKTDTIGLKKYISKLNPKSHKVLDLIYFKGFTQQETSDHLNIPLGTVKTQARTTIKKLRAMML